MTDEQLQTFILWALKDADAKWRQQFGAAQISPSRMKNMANALYLAWKADPAAPR